MPLADLDTPKELNLHLRAGDSFARSVQLQEADGSPANLTGYTPRAQIRDRPGGTLLATLTTGVVGLPTDGIISYALTVTQTRALAAAEPGMVWDLEVDAGDTQTTTVAAGTVTICPEVTVAP